MTSPEVSVLMPVRDVEATVDAAIRSIVGQTFTDWELIVVDDGSRDATVRRLRDWARRDERIRVVLHRESRGVAVRLNEAVRLAAGELVARMDGDDVSYPARLATQVAYLREHRDVDLVGANRLVFHGEGVPRGSRVNPARHGEIVANALRSVRVSHPTWLGRRDWFTANPYDISAHGCEDEILLLRAHTASRYANIPEILLGYREDRIKLGSSWRARRALVPQLLRYGSRNRALGPALRESVLHAGKAVRDAVAVGLRREEMVLARRNTEATREDVERWAAVWGTIAEADQVACHDRRE